MRQKIAALGLDVGKKRLGVAGCDGTGLIATEIETIERTSFAKDLDRLRKIIADREVNILVIGLPYSLNGTLGFQAQQVQKFAEKVSHALDLPVEYVDERLTSVEAIELLKAQKRFSTRDKGAIDRLAAVIILQQWLDMRRSRNG
jgi:putative Holliday junction resolvase